MKANSKEEIRQIRDFLNKLKKPLDIAIPNDFYRNAEIKAKQHDTIILS